MDRAFLRQATAVDSDQILTFLTQRQHVEPHATVRQVLEHGQESLGICPIASAEAIARLNVDDSRAIGRLRRTEVMQLARSIHRLWREQMAGASRE